MFIEHPNDPVHNLPAEDSVVTAEAAVRVVFTEDTLFGAVCKIMQEDDKMQLCMDRTFNTNIQRLALHRAGLLVVLKEPTTL